MQLLAEDPFAIFRLPCPSKSVKRLAQQIDHRRGGDADIRLNERTLHVARGNGGDLLLRIEKTDLPERFAGAGIGVKSVNAIAFRGDEDDIVHAFAGDFDLRDVQRLSINVAIDGKGSDATKLRDVDILRSGDCFE